MEILLMTLSGILMATFIVGVAFWMSKQSNRTLWIIVATALSAIAAILVLSL